MQTNELANDPLVRAAILERLAGNESGPANRLLAAIDVLAACRPTIRIPSYYGEHRVGEQAIATDAIVLLVFRDTLARLLKSMEGAAQKPFCMARAVESAYRFSAVFALVKTVVLMGDALHSNGCFDVASGLSRAVDSLKGLKLCRLCGEPFRVPKEEPNVRVCGSKCERRYKQAAYKLTVGPKTNRSRREKRITDLAKVWSTREPAEVERAFLDAVRASGAERKRLVQKAVRLAGTPSEMVAADRFYHLLSRSSASTKPH